MNGVLNSALVFKLQLLLYVKDEKLTVFAFDVGYIKPMLVFDLVEDLLYDEKVH